VQRPPSSSRYTVNQAGSAKEKFHEYSEHSIHPRIHRHYRNIRLRRSTAILGLLFYCRINNDIPKRRSGGRCTEPIPDLFVRVSPSVVSISAVEIDRFESESGMRFVAGSGFIISDDGLVLTNSHVVFDRQAITVTMDDGRRIKATL